ncbi:MAG: polysaccharide biosynthesis/export family protein [Candidatus Omnitrophica bacterium]|nr:polysaccharide biosynthesis/export family protein [Candidatus Omnitrophota bacterium]
MAKNRNFCASVNLIITVIAVLIISLTTRVMAVEDQKPEVPDIGKIVIISASEIEQKEWSLENYVIDSGDVLEISVWQVEELSRKVVVRPDGNISYPLIGEVVTGGKTVEDLTQDISDKLKTYIKAPKVSVIITQFGGKKIVVLGEVANKGIIRFTEPIRIMEVLALSGGYTESAGLKSVLVIRGDLKNNTDVIVVNVMEIFKGNLRQNIYVRKHDLIFVPRSFIGNVAYFVRQISPLLGAAQQYYDVKKIYYDIKRKDYRYDETS